MTPADHPDASGRRLPPRRDDAPEPPYEYVYEPPAATLPPRFAPNLPVDADAPENRRPATPLTALLDSILERLAPRAGGWLDDAAAHWADWVGAEAAASSRPGKFADGTLYVYVKGSARLAEMKRHQLQAIDARVRRKAGKAVRAVRLLIDPGD